MPSKESEYMAANRRVVTGRGKDGKAAFLSDAPATRTVSWEPGGEPAISWIWASEDVPEVSSAEGDPAADFTSFFPGPGGTRFMIETFPAGFGVDDLDRLDGYLERIQASGVEFVATVQDGTLHASSTVDFAVVLSGQIMLELDPGVDTILGPGDCVVQNGVPHSWRNTGTEPCTLAFVVVGAKA
jgi:mannose-6-phosphate isomerase-like protein (cupin superfamily)